VGSLVTLGVTAAGVGAGYLIAKGTGVKPGISMIGGGAVGLVGSIYPSLLARRSVLRTAECSDPKLSSILLYMLAGGALRAALAAGGNATGSKSLAGLAGMAGFLTAPLVGQSIVKA
jgi:hypothetical protein